MYNKARRFRDLCPSTPARVGPTTYILPEYMRHTSHNMYAPFNSTQIRDTTFVNKNLAVNPSPMKYKICFRKQRIIGGTSLQNRASRFKYRTRNLNKGPYSSASPHKLPGKLLRGVPPRNRATAVSSVPDKRTQGYQLTAEGPVKIQTPVRDPTTYYNPQGQTERYKGIFWSLRRSERLGEKVREGPGPAQYMVTRAHVSDFEKYQVQLRSVRRAQAPLLRTNDILQRTLCRQNLPGPGSYSPVYQHKKCDCGKSGTFTKAKRQDLYKKSEGPGPAKYDPRTATNKNIGPSTFRPTQELPEPTNQHSTPGPGDYDPKGSLWDEIKKKGHCQYNQWKAPFDTSAERKLCFVNPDSGCVPAPDWYYPTRHQEKRDYSRQSCMFASRTSREATVQSQNTPGPASYCTFKLQTASRSFPPFLSTSARLEPLRGATTPGPGSYNLGASTLNKKGCIIGLRLEEKGKDTTPGPLDYVVHEKYAKSALFNTHNFHLKKSEVTHLHSSRKLRCFSKQTGHCPWEHSAK